MPHALKHRQREYLDFLRQFIQENEDSPRLDEIDAHFGIKSPTAHKTLEALQRKGYLYFGRDSVSVKDPILVPFESGKIMASLGHIGRVASHPVHRI